MNGGGRSAMFEMDGRSSSSWNLASQCDSKAVTKTRPGGTGSSSPKPPETGGAFTIFVIFSSLSESSEPVAGFSAAVGDGYYPDSGEAFDVNDGEGEFNEPDFSSGLF